MTIYRYAGHDSPLYSHSSPRNVSTALAYLARSHLQDPSPKTVQLLLFNPSTPMDSREYMSIESSAPEFCFHSGSDSEQPGWFFDPALPAEPSSSASRVGYTPRRWEPLLPVGGSILLPQAFEPILSPSTSHTESMGSENDWSFGTYRSEGDQPGLGTLSSQHRRPLISSTNPWSSEYVSETVYDSHWATGHSTSRAELSSWELRHSEFATDLPFDTQSYNLSMSDIEDDISFSGTLPLTHWADSRCHCDWTGERDDPTRLRRVTETQTEDSASYAQSPKKPYACPLVECSSQFLHYSDLSRHQRTVHMRQESRQGYRCAFKGCPKADKIWTRLDSFKQHVLKRHQNADVQDIIKQSDRSTGGADTYFPFAITTPTTMLRRRHN